VTAWILFTLACVGALLAAERHHLRWGVVVAKPLASTGFLGTALAAGAAGSPYGRLVLLALALCWLGDVLLIPRGASRAFLLGLTSFLLGHLAFALAFALRGLAPALAGVALVIATPPAALAWRWLAPHVPRSLRLAVLAYVVVISTMVVTAAGTLGAGGGLAIPLGALCFYLSDLAVARERFVASSFWNKAWGLPLYYTATLLLAASGAG